MYNNVYQEYINNMIGAPTPKPMSFENTFEHTANYRNQDSMNLEKLYPDLYKLLYPMIQKACMKNTKPLSEAVLDEMTAEIYSNFVSEEDGTFLNINLTNDVRSSSKPLESKVDKTSAKIISTSKSEEKRNTEKSETRNFRPNNFVLRDLIRILLIRELIGRPQRPQIPPPPMRPGFPGGGRPPFRANDFEIPEYEMYENPIYMYSNGEQGYNIF